MSIISKIFRKTSRPAQKSTPVVWPLPPGSFLEQAFSSYAGTISPAQAFKFYRTNSTVATAVDMISDACLSVKPVLQDKNGKFIENHDILDLLKQPNGFETYSEFARNMFNHYLITHNSHLAAYGRLGSTQREL